MWDRAGEIIQGNNSKYGMFTIQLDYSTFEVRRFFRLLKPLLSWRPLSPAFVLEHLVDKQPVARWLCQRHQMYSEEQFWNGQHTHPGEDFSDFFRRAEILPLISVLSSRCMIVVEAVTAIFLHLFYNQWMLNKNTFHCVCQQRQRGGGGSQRRRLSHVPWIEFHQS